MPFFLGLLQFEDLLTLLHDDRSKGLTENLLAGLGYSDTMVFRPGFLMNAERPNKRVIEFVLVYVLS